MLFYVKISVKDNTEKRKNKRNLRCDGTGKREDNLSPALSF